MLAKADRYLVVVPQKRTVIRFRCGLELQQIGVRLFRNGRSNGGQRLFVVGLYVPFISASQAAQAHSLISEAAYSASIGAVKNRLTPADR